MTSRPNVGSSKNNTLGFDISESAIDNFLWYPPDSLDADLSLYFSKSNLL